MADSKSTQKSTKTLTLSDGRTALVGRGKGIHLQRAAAAAKDGTNPIDLFMASVAEVTKIDGKKIVYEDVLEMDMGDVLALIGAVGGNLPGLSLPSATSS